MTSPRPIAIDLFSGAGGVTQGLRDAGYEVRAAIEIDQASIATYRLNHADVEVIDRDIRTVEPFELMDRASVVAGQVDLLTACAPCQGFSSLNTRRRLDEARDDLVLNVLRFVEALQPRTVAFENVPRLKRDRRFQAFVEGLRDLGYGVNFQVVDAAHYGVPQRRRRLLAIARAGIPNDAVTLPEPLGIDQRRDVTAAFLGLPPIGEEPLHRDRPYPPLVMQRIQAIPKDGGSRFDLPEDLQLACHSKLPRRNATASYGRMWWYRPAPTITSKCTVPSCGRFLHPEQDRVITLREAARLQSFGTPNHEYQFDLAFGRGAVASQIGNAVPVALAEAVARAVIRQATSNPIFSD